MISRNICMGDQELTKKWLMVFAGIFLSAAVRAEDCVVLLHGLASHPMIMKPLEIAIDIQPEFRVVNQGYNSYAADIPSLAAEVVPEAIEACELNESESISFVTHSMGGLLLRAYLVDSELRALDTVVMVAPPNHGSEVVDWVQKFPWLVPVLGPAGGQLGTDSDEVPNLLPSPEFNLGVIAGTKEHRVLWKELMSGENDGKVSAQSARVENMDGYREIEAGHSRLLFERETIEQVLSFLRYGQFDIHQLGCEVGDEDATASGF